MAMFGSSRRGPSEPVYTSPPFNPNAPQRDPVWGELDPQLTAPMPKRRGMLGGIGKALGTAAGVAMMGPAYFAFQQGRKDGAAVRESELEDAAVERQLRRAQAEKAMRPEDDRTGTQKDIEAAGLQPGTPEYQQALLTAVQARSLPDGIVMGPQGPQPLPGFMTPAQRVAQNFDQQLAMADRSDARSLMLADRTDARSVASQENQLRMLMERDRLQSERDDRRRRDGLRVIPGSAAGAIQDNEKQLRAIDDAIASVRANPKAFGGQNFLPGFLTQRLPGPGLKDGVDERSKVSNIGSLEIKDRSGAAVTAAEFPRIAPFIPQATDTPDKVVKNLLNMRAILADEVTTAKDFYSESNGYRPYVGGVRPAAPNAGVRPVPAKAAPQAAVQYLRQNPATAAAFDAKYGKGASARYLGRR